MNTKKKEKDVVVISVSADLILDELKSLEDDVMSALNEQSKHIVLDLQNTTYITSLGIHSLINILKTIEANSATIKFVNLAENVKRTLSVIGLLRFIDVFETKDAALDSFNENVSILEKNLLWD